MLKNARRTGKPKDGKFEFKQLKFVPFELTDMVATLFSMCDSEIGPPASSTLIVMYHIMAWKWGELDVADELAKQQRHRYAAARK